MVLNAINKDHRLYLEGTGLSELGPRRIGAMNEAGLNVQILSAHTPGVQNVPGQEGIDFAYRLNKMLVDGPMATYPGRFEAFATLPLQNPEASADELERAVREDGFLGCLTNGIIGKKFLDHPDFEPVLARAEALNVPIYIHPGFPPDEVFEIYYSTTLPEYKEEYQDYIFSGSGYGWHQEVLTQCLRMITYGVFDRFPKLQIIIGHMGEGLPFYYERIVGEMSEVTEDSLNKPIEQYFHDNFWFTTSAFFQDELLHLLLKYISVDRVMFATDYPFADMKEGTDWFRAVDLPREAKEKIAFRNAEKLFGIKV
jgi:predicted TIM-barrel fold metal-dependent hydrolase